MTDNFITLGHAFPLTHRDHSDASNEAPAAHGTRPLFNINPSIVNNHSFLPDETVYNTRSRIKRVVSLF